jgi:hypothetical protein
MQDSVIVNIMVPRNWFFRTFRAMEAILGNALLGNRLPEPIQHQYFFGMEEVSTESAKEPRNWTEQ